MFFTFKCGGVLDFFPYTNPMIIFITVSNSMGFITVMSIMLLIIICFYYSE